MYFTAHNLLTLQMVATATLVVYVIDCMHLYIYTTAGSAETERPPSTVVYDSGDTICSLHSPCAPESSVPLHCLIHGLMATHDSCQPAG